jgi:hypothetical protein
MVAKLSGKLEDMVNEAAKRQAMDAHAATVMARLQVCCWVLLGVARCLLGVAGCCWVLLGVAGCRVLLGDAGCRWVSLGVAGCGVLLGDAGCCWVTWRR